MAWFNSVTRSVADSVQGLATGVWAVVATPFVYTPLRPVTKQAIKGGLWIARGAQSIVEMTQEEWRDIVAEAQQEAHEEQEPLQLEADASAVSDAQHTNGEPAGATTERASAPDAADAFPASDLTEVKGIGEDYARLLGAAGITSVAQLAAREPEALRTRLRDANDTHEIVGRVPSTGRLRNWIERAGEHAG
jgi:predicted flap endonuclease-1-like 5' DNA nuclease